MSKAILATSTILILALVSVSMVAHPVFALKNLFKCITDASSGGSLSFKDYVACFNHQFHGQLNNNDATLSDSVKP